MMRPARNVPNGLSTHGAVGAPMTAAASSNDSERGLAAVAYILTWITGLIIYFVAKPEQHYAKWHAIQAIGLGIVATLGAIVFSILPIPFLGAIWGLLVIVAIIVFAVKAYQGERMRLPMIADMADKNA